jgi:hypothetical protein
VRRTAGFDVPDFLAAGPRDVLVPESGLGVARQVLVPSDAERAPEQVPAVSPAVSPGMLLAAILVAVAVMAALLWLFMR